MQSVARIAARRQARGKAARCALCAVRRPDGAARAPGSGAGRATSCNILRPGPRWPRPRASPTDRTSRRPAPPRLAPPPPGYVTSYCTTARPCWSPPGRRGGGARCLRVAGWRGGGGARAVRSSLVRPTWRGGGLCAWGQGRHAASRGGGGGGAERSVCFPFPRAGLGGATRHIRVWCACALILIR